MSVIGQIVRRNSMEPKADISIRKMSPSDIGVGMQLKESAGWNQVPADWEAYLELEPEGCFVAEVNGKSVATTTTINYQERFGWIGMVIVDPTVRGRGIATQMVNHALAYLESVSCRCQKLDATDAGARVYEKMGFTVEYEVQRWQGSGRIISGSSLAVTPLSAVHLGRLSQLDTAAFGAPRMKLLKWYGSNDCPGFLAGDPENPAGFVLGRRGSRAWQMGPLVTENNEAAELLMMHFLASLPGQAVIADLVAHNKEAIRLLERFGFTCQRVLQRMYRGQNCHRGKPQQTICLAGFEFG